MTGSQRLVLILGLVLLAGCLLYPPWHLRIAGVTIASSGYAFLFSGPTPYGTADGLERFASLDLTLLFTQMGAVAALTGATFVALGWRRKP